MKTALLIIDIQNDYFEGGTMTLSGSKEAGENAGRILQQARKTGQPVIIVQHIGSENSSFFKPGTTGAEIRAVVAPAKGEKVIQKHSPNSFIETDLLAYLQEQKITDLVICGMMTHMCIDATTRAASDLGFNVTLIGDACATKDLTFDGMVTPAKAVQSAFLAALNGTYAEVISTESYLKH